MDGKLCALKERLCNGAPAYRDEEQAREHGHLARDDGSWLSYAEVECQKQSRQA